MKNKLTITVSDINGTKHYEVHQAVKKFIIYFLLFIFLIVGGSFYLINFLMDEVETLEKKKELIAKEEEKLKEEKRILQEEIAKKTEEFENIRDKVEDIEELIGLKPSKESENIEKRIDLIKISSNERKLIVNSIPQGFPVRGAHITSGFGWRIHPISHTRKFHHGLDFGGRIGLPIRVTADGIVTSAGFNRGGYGYVVKVMHNFGFETIYGHMTKNIKVKVGDFVKKGDIIGYLGNSGRSTGPHLHYEVRFIDRILNPINFVRWSIINFDEIFKKEDRVPWHSLVEAIKHQQDLFLRLQQAAPKQKGKASRQKRQSSHQARK